MKLCLWGSAILIAACSVDSSRNDAPLSEDEKQIRAQREFTNDAIEKHDTLALGKVWLEDYLLISSRNVENKGRGQALRSIGQQFSSRPDLIYRRMPVKVTVYSRWKMASENGTWTGHWTENDSTINVSGDYYAKWHKVNDLWLLRAEVFTAHKCSGGGYCDTTPF